MKLLSTLSLFAVSFSSAFAFTFDDVQFWVGSGSKQALIVIDFQQPAGASSFAWGYRWDGTATGEQAFRALLLSDASLQADIFGSEASAYLDAVRYQPTAGGWAYEGRTWPEGWWSYWQSDSGTTWTEATTGFGTTVLIDQHWEGWSYNVGTGFDAPAPNEPVAAVPEPASLAVLGLGAMMLLRRRKR